MHHLLRPCQAAAAAALLCGTLSAGAAISPGINTSGINDAYSGEGELFMVAYDSDAKVSYTLDLGETQSAFLQKATVEAGYQKFWEVSDANWGTFLNAVNPANLHWAVHAIDQTGGNVPGALRLFTTLKQGTESLLIDVEGLEEGSPTGLARLEALSNQDFGNGMGSSQAGTFFNAVNLTGTHGANGQAPVFADNGSSVNFDSDPGNSYYGDGSIGLSSTLNNRLKNGVNFGNTLGQSSWFYYITRSSTNQLEATLIDEFDNSGADGYFGFLFVDPTLYPSSPYAGKYLLSYTLAAAGPTQAQREFAQSIGRTEWSIGGHVEAVGGLTVAGVSEGPALWQAHRLGGLTETTLPTSPVPEPGAALLLAAGLVVVARAARRG